MDVQQLLRLKGMVEASVEPGPGHASEAQAQAYLRVRGLVRETLEGGAGDEFDKLFPETFSTTGRPWRYQSDEAVVLMRQLAGWLSGLIEGELLERRIRAEAEERARRTGFAG